MKSCALLQLDEIGVLYGFVGVITRIETGPIRVLTITDHRVASFSDLSEIMIQIAITCFWAGGWAMGLETVQGWIRNNGRPAT